MKYFINTSLTRVHIERSPGVYWCGMRQQPKHNEVKVYVEKGMVDMEEGGTWVTLQPAPTICQRCQENATLHGVPGALVTIGFPDMDSARKGAKLIEENTTFKTEVHPA